MKSFLAKIILLSIPFSFLQQEGGKLLGRALPRFRRRPQRVWHCPLSQEVAGSLEESTNITDSVSENSSR